MKITEVRVTLTDEEKLKGFANVTFDNCFVVRGIKVIRGANGIFVSMPSRKRPDGSFQDVAYPVSADLRREMEYSILGAYETQIRTRARSEREPIFK